jgi:hypothetical protein
MSRSEKSQDSAENLSSWRENREAGWTRDIGYSLQETLSQHRYDYTNKGARPDDPGWHKCTCGWEGYWCDFLPHVTDHLRDIVTPQRSDEQKGLI